MVNAQERLTTKPDVRRIGDVRALHLDRSGHTTWTLRFLAGTSDETFRTTGLAHLVEHLVMDNVPKLPASANAVVTPDLMEFWVRGTADSVIVFARAISDGIAKLREVTAEQIAHEAGVLEAEGTGPAVGALPLSERYGFVGYGLGAIAPVSTATIHPSDLRDWVTRLLVAENAVVTVQGPWVDDVALDLPHGLANQRPTPRPTGMIGPRQVPLPDLPGVVLGLELRRGPGMSAVERVVSELLHERLRIVLGHSYSVSFEQIVLDDTCRAVSFLVDAAPGRERAVAIEALREIRRIAVEGPPQADLTHDADTLEALLDDPEFADAILHRAASSMLRGSEDVEDARDTVAVLRTLTPDDVRDVIADGLQTLVIAFPGEEPLTTQECDGSAPPPSPPCTAAPITGREHQRRLVGSRAPRGTRLVVNDDAIAVHLKGDEWHVIRFDDAVGLGVGDGYRQLVSLTSCTIPLERNDFKGAEEVMDILDSRIAPALCYPLESPQ